MHEISLVRTIFRTLEEQFQSEELNRIEAIQLKIGPLANVEPMLLQNAYEAVIETEAPRFKGAALKVNYIPILVRCTVCDATSEVHNYRFVCEACGVPCAQVVQGNELLIEQVVLRD